MTVKITSPRPFFYPEDDMSESQPQINLTTYLKAVLNYLYAAVSYFVTGNLEIVLVKHVPRYPDITPDVMLVEQVVSQAEQAALHSWNMNQPNRPAPAIVFEISSRSTWPNDLDPKPVHYGLVGVKEYFAYDPENFWPDEPRFLRGWRYEGSQPIPLQMDAQGRLWSEVLQSYLVPDGAMLRLVDRQGQPRLTAEEAFNQARQVAEAERLLEENRRLQAETARQQAEQRLAEEAARRQQLEEYIAQLLKNQPPQPEN